MILEDSLRQLNHGDLIRVELEDGEPLIRIYVDFDPQEKRMQVVEVPKEDSQNPCIEVACLRYDSITRIEKFIPTELYNKNRETTNPKLEKLY